VFGVDDVQVASADGVEVEQCDPGEYRERYAEVEPACGVPPGEQVVAEEKRHGGRREEGIDPD
jgi:hypothetical protein